MHLLTLLLVLMFALVIAYFCYSVYFYGGRWVANPYNPRISSRKQHVVMGTLTDRNGTVLAYTDEDGRRRYNGSAATRKAVCQVVGDSGGKVSTGADTFHAQFLLGFRSSIFERLADAFTGTTQRGDDVRLTISERLSRYISEQFPRGQARRGRRAQLQDERDSGDGLHAAVRPDEHGFGAGRTRRRARSSTARRRGCIRPARRSKS